MNLFLFTPSFLAAQSGGFFYAWSVSTLVGKAIIFILLFVSIISWTVMITKFSQIRQFLRKNDDFMKELRAEERFVAIFQKGKIWKQCPLFELYTAGCRGIQGSLGAGDTIKIKLLEESLERAVAEQVVLLESQISILGTVVGTAPFLGLLGTVWGVMDAFTGVALSGSASIGSLAPGISAALITTVIGLVVALPSMVGYNLLLGNIRQMTVAMENFASEFISTARKEIAAS